MSVSNLQKGLFSLRLGVFSVMLLWSLDKILNPEHAAKVFSHFYMIPNLSIDLAMVIGAIQLAFVVAFVLGIRKNITYSAILIMHSISTFSSYQVYMTPFGSPNMLFFAAFPMLAACYTLYLMKDEDTFLNLKI